MIQTKLTTAKLGGRKRPEPEEEVICDDVVVDDGDDVDDDDDADDVEEDEEDDEKKVTNLKAHRELPGTKKKSKKSDNGEPEAELRMPLNLVGKHVHIVYDGDSRIIRSFPASSNVSTGEFLRASVKRFRKYEPMKEQYGKGVPLCSAKTEARFVNQPQDRSHDVLVDEDTAMEFVRAGWDQGVFAVDSSTIVREDDENIYARRLVAYRIPGKFEADVDIPPPTLPTDTLTPFQQAPLAVIVYNGLKAIPLAEQVAKMTDLINEWQAVKEKDSVSFQEWENGFRKYAVVQVSKKEMKDLSEEFGVEYISGHGHLRPNSNLQTDGIFALFDPAVDTNKAANMSERDIHDHFRDFKPNIMIFYPMQVDEIPPVLQKNKKLLKKLEQRYPTDS